MSRPRCVVIDSGVDPAHPALAGRVQVTAGPRFDRTGPAEPDGGATDELGHGSAVAATIASFVPDVEILSVRVFDRDATCDFEAVLHALRHAVGLGAPLVNLSLGTTSLRHRRALQRALADGRARGVRVVAPASYGGLPCDPGNLASVEAVVGDPNVLPQMPELRPYGDRLIWFASPLPAREADGGRQLRARGESLAVAAVTGVLLRAERERANRA